MATKLGSPPHQPALLPCRTVPRERNVHASGFVTTIPEMATGTDSAPNELHRQASEHMKSVTQIFEVACGEPARLTPGCEQGDQGDRYVNHVAPGRLRPAQGSFRVSTRSATPLTPSGSTHAAYEPSHASMATPRPDRRGGR
jgi:hypothetical protein